MSKETHTLTRLIEPTVILAAITAVLYFWGYVYFSVYCEQLGASFSGLDVPLPHYLVIGWAKITYIAMTLCIILSFAEFFIWLVKIAATAVLRPLFKKYTEFFEKVFGSSWVDDLPEGKLNKIGLLIAIVFMCAAWGTMDLVEQAQAQADKVLTVERPVIVYDMNHKSIDGSYIYLGNFDGDLIVGEINEDSEKPNIRIFKDGSYSSYILKQISRPEETTEAKKSAKIEN